MKISWGKLSTRTNHQSCLEGTLDILTMQIQPNAILTPKREDLEKNSRVEGQAPIKGIKRSPHQGSTASYPSICDVVF